MNLGLAYYKEYYRAVDLRPEKSKKPADNSPKHLKEEWSDFMKVNKASVQNSNELLLDSNLEEVKNSIDIPPNKIANRSFELKTIYPGLLAGSGYLHEFSIEEALMLGFSFDHSSGLPCIPASSVKGLLRHACEVNNGAYLRQLIKEVVPGLIAFDPKNFVKEVFDGVKEEEVKGVKVDKRTGIYERDLFFDALPIRSLNNNGSFMGEDFITPHINREDRTLDGLKNPVPLKFLKVLPEVIFQFSFLLKGEKSGLSAQNRKDLFKKILLELGIGAKTNVGYGQFVEESAEEKQEREKRELQLKKEIEEAERAAKEKEAEKARTSADKDFIDEFVEIPHGLPVEQFDRTFDGEIFRIADKKFFIRYDVDGKTCEFKRIRKKIKPEDSTPKEGDKIEVRIQCDPEKKDNPFSITVTIKS